jgi:predicted ATP-dependent endonuclease of OLD family
MSIKINSLQIENVKRVKAVHLEPTQNGLTVLGGKSGQGKTSVLDAIAWVLGGAKREPSNPKRNGSLNPPTISLTLNNGLVVERKGKSSTLTVKDPSGKTSGQALLDSFVSQFALDLPKFLNASTKDKATALLNTLGIGDTLRTLDESERSLYDQRVAIGRVKDAKAKHAQELPEYPDAPDEPVSISELIQQQQAILAKNGDNQRKRDSLLAIEAQKYQQEEKVRELKHKLAELETALEKTVADLTTAKKTVAELQDESTAEIEQSIGSIESINAQVSANMAKQAASDEAETYSQQYNGLTEKIESVRAERLALLDSANLPLPGLTVEGGELLYNGQKWDCMGSSEQLKVSVAIVRAIKPECGFVLMDQLEKMDKDTMLEFGAWLEAEGLQVIATRVTTHADECTLIIEDGLPQGSSYVEEVTGIKADVTETATATTTQESNPWD